MLQTRSELGSPLRTFAPSDARGQQGPLASLPPSSRWTLTFSLIQPTTVTPPRPRWRGSPALSGGAVAETSSPSIRPKELRLIRCPARASTLR